MHSDMKIGDKSAEIGNWQRFLNELKILDWEKRPLAIDENYGMRTSFVTRKWQETVGLKDTGIVRAEERIIAQNLGFIPFIQAKNCNILYPVMDKRIDIIVIHTMENDEKPTAAENVALWFAGLTKYEAPKSSANYCIDNDSIIQCVRDTDIAWHCPGINHNGIGIEHAGRAGQTDAQWRDEASQAILRNSAHLSAKLVKKHNIPIQKLSPDELKLKVRGFCGHIDGTIAFPGPNRTHYDPGKFFPWGQYLDLVQSLL